MKFSKKTVSQTPLKRLWTDAGEVNASRQRYLNRAELKELVTQQALTFVIASIGTKLSWIHEDACSDFWNAEVERHIPEEEEFSPEDFPAHYVYVPSEWIDDAGKRIILLETYH